MYGASATNAISKNGSKSALSIVILMLFPSLQELFLFKQLLQQPQEIWH